MQRYESFFEGQVTEMRLDSGGIPLAWIACQEGAVPAPGRYLMAWLTASMEAATGWPLFSVRTAVDGFLTVTPGPGAWYVGAALTLRGPLGNGFTLPVAARRVVLAALDRSAARLLPLVDRALEQGAALAIFSDAPIPALPAAVEAAPLGALPEALAWADYLALDIPRERLTELRTILGLSPNGRFNACAAQALVITGLPCGGLADCGVCSLQTGKRWKLACKDGPVFDLNSLL